MYTSKLFLVQNYNKFINTASPSTAPSAQSWKILHFQLWGGPVYAPECVYIFKSLLSGAKTSVVYTKGMTITITFSPTSFSSLLFFEEITSISSICPQLVNLRGTFFIVNKH